MNDESKKICVFNWMDRTLPLHALLKFCGREIALNQDYRWSGLRRGRSEFILWQHTISGEGVLVYEGQELRITPGDSMLIHIPHDHCYYLPKDSKSWSFIFAGFNGREAIRICRDIERKAGPCHRFRNGSCAVSALEDVCALAESGGIRNRFDASAAAYRLVMALASELETNSCSPGKRMLKDASDLCLNSPGILPDVAEMAKAAGCSRSHFSRLFKAETGKSPGDFVRSHALQRASALLQTGGYSVKEVAERCGFSSSAVFCRTFKKGYGFSPGQMKLGQFRRDKAE